MENEKFQEIDPDVMYGIAKKFNHEMMAFPMYTHSAIVELVRCGMQHRNLALVREDKDAQDALQKQAVEIRLEELKLMAKAQEQGYRPPSGACDLATGGVANGRATGTLIDPTDIN